MARISAPRTFLLFPTLLSATLLTAIQAPPVWAQAVVDGQATETACAALGFSPPSRAQDGANFAMPRMLPGGIVGAAPPAMAAMPPMPSPAPGAAVRAAEAPGLPPRNTELYPDADPNPVKQVAEAPVSTFSIDVDTAAYANVRRFLNDGNLPPRDAVRVEELVNYFDYGYALPETRDTPFAISATVVPSPWAPGKEIIHIGLQGYEIPAAEQPPLNLVFLVDVSGSMLGPDRLGLIQKSLNLLIDQMRPEDRVSLAVYAGAAGAVLPPTAGDQKLKLRCAVDALQAGGSTAGGEGLRLAYDMAQQNFDDDAVNRVILMTDGDFNVGIANPEMLEDFVAEKRSSGVYLSVYGFGRGNYNDTMMQTLSQNGNGTAAYIDTLEEARKLFLTDLTASMFPIADDVKIQVEFNPARVAEYRLIGYETRLLNREDFNNDAVDAGEVGAGASVTALYEITPVGGPVAVDPLRYQPAAAPGGDPSGELAFLRIRYKLPGGEASELIERPITDADRPADLAAAPEATRWAVAVAAYGQRLRGDEWLGAGYGWDDILSLAQGARGDDPFGIRAEFVQLVRAAETARPQ